VGPAVGDGLAFEVAQFGEEVDLVRVRGGGLGEFVHRLAGVDGGGELGARDFAGAGEGGGEEQGEQGKHQGRLLHGGVLLEGMNNDCPVVGSVQVRIHLPACVGMTSSKGTVARMQRSGIRGLVRFPGCRRSAPLSGLRA
jgi:hypothetical protein